MAALQIGIGMMRNNACLVIGLIAGVFTAMGPALARDLVIVAGNLPPQMDESGQGREATIIRETLAECGYRVRFRIYPFTRHWSAYRMLPDVDGVATVPDDMPQGSHPSRPYIRYQNGASVLASANRPPAALADLAGKHVVTFAGGQEILPGLADFAPKLGSLREQIDQLIHANLLFSGRVDVVLSDGLIFAEYNRQLQDRVRQGDRLGFDPFLPVRFRAIFPPTAYHMEFRNAAVRDDFDRCYATLAASNRIAAINRAWIEPYRGMVGDQYLGY